MIRAVLGGSFDPVHRGHVAVVERLLHDGLADEVRLVPVGIPPHRSPPLASGPDRVAMLEVVFKDLPGTAVDDREIRRAGPSFTVDTLAELTAAYPADRWRLVVGADHLDGFGRWRNPQRILDLADLIVFRRGRGPGGGRAEGLHEIHRVLAASGLTGHRIHWVDDFDEPVSSAVVRVMLDNGIDAGDSLPPAVGAYIAAHGLYRT